MDGLVEFTCPNCGKTMYMYHTEVHMRRIQISDGNLHIPCPDCDGEMLSPYEERGGLIYPTEFIPFPLMVS